MVGATTVTPAAYQSPIRSGRSRRAGHVKSMTMLSLYKSSCAGPAAAGSPGISLPPFGFFRISPATDEASILAPLGLSSPPRNVVPARFRLRIGREKQDPFCQKTQYRGV